jgi:tRNA-dihydrouridine synthase
LAAIIDTAHRHIAEDCRLRGYRLGSFLVRKHLVRYFKGFPGAATIRRRLFATEDGPAMLEVAEQLREELLAGVLVGEALHD